MTNIIFMEPLEMRGGYLIKDQINYARDARRQLKSIINNPKTKDHRKYEDTIIISVRVIGSGSCTALQVTPNKSAWSGSRTSTERDSQRLTLHSSILTACSPS